MSTISQPLPAKRHRAVKNPMTWYMPRFWHGMRLSTWSREMLRNRLAMSPSRVPMACAVTCVSAHNSALALADRAVYGRQAAAAKLAEPPLFILGHWRSGTTFLHELLIRDPRHTFATTYQCFAPHHFLLTDGVIPRWTKFLLPKRRPMDDMAMGWERPQEDEFALQNLGVPTPYLSALFPNRGSVYRDYLTLRDLSPAARQAWQRQLGAFFQRIALRDPRRLIMKSPPHTARIRTLLEIFPQAKFVHLSREPQSLYWSTIGLWRSLNEVSGAQVPRDEGWLGPYVVETLQRMYAAYFEDRRLLAADQLVEMKYEDLIENPKERLRTIYQTLNLGDFPPVEGAIDAHLSEVRNYHANRHERDESVAAELREQWREYYEQFEYA